MESTVMGNTQENTTEEKESRAEKFIRLAEYRVNKAQKAIAALKHLGNRASYEYTQVQVDEMFDALEANITDVKSAFSKRDTTKPAFSFNSRTEGSEE